MRITLGGIAVGRAEVYEDYIRRYSGGAGGARALLPATAPEPIEPHCPKI
jgi:hypothetical protein